MTRPLLLPPSSGRSPALSIVRMLTLAHIVLSMVAPTDAFFLFQKPGLVKSSSPLLPELENLIEASNNGLDSSNQQEVKDLMTTISNSRKGDQREYLPGRWELIYTTEKEINCEWCRSIRILGLGSSFAFWKLNFQSILSPSFSLALCKNASLQDVVAICQGVVHYANLGLVRRQEC